MTRHNITNTSIYSTKGKDATRDQFYKWSTAALDLEFFFSYAGCLTKNKESSLPTISVSFFKGISTFMDYLSKSHSWRKTAVVLFNP